MPSCDPRVSDYNFNIVTCCLTITGRREPVTIVYEAYVHHAHRRFRDERGVSGEKRESPQS